MKQKCQLQIGQTQYKNAATQLSISGIQYHMSALSNEVFGFVLAQGTLKLSTKVKM